MDQSRGRRERKQAVHTFLALLDTTNTVLELLHMSLNAHRHPRHICRSFLLLENPLLTGRRVKVPMSAARPMSTSFTASFTSFVQIRMSAQLDMSIARPKEKPWRTQITAIPLISCRTYECNDLI